MKFFFIASMEKKEKTSPFVSFKPSTTSPFLQEGSEEKHHSIPPPQKKTS